jgi:hypothetical protein
MHPFPAVNILLVLLAAVAAFGWAALYWLLISPGISRLAHVESAAATLGKSPLAVAFGTRVVQAFAVAVVLGYAGVSEPGPGAIGGVLVFVGTVLPFMASQAAFGVPWGTWSRFAVGVPEVLIGFAIMGAIILL